MEPLKVHLKGATSPILQTIHFFWVQIGSLGFFSPFFKQNHGCDSSNFCNIAAEGLAVTRLTTTIAIKARIKPGNSS